MNNVLEDLKVWAALKPGDPIPGRPNNLDWGPPLTDLFRRSINEIERLRCALGGRKEETMDKSEVESMIEATLNGDAIKKVVHEAIVEYGSDEDDESIATPTPAHDPKKTSPWSVIVYLLAAMGTFVQIQHYSSFNELDRKVLSVMAPLLWPFYWGGVGTYYVGQGVLALDTYVAKSLASPMKALSCTDDKSGSWAPDANGVCHMPAISQMLCSTDMNVTTCQPTASWRHE